MLSERGNTELKTLDALLIARVGVSPRCHSEQVEIGVVRGTAAAAHREREAGQNFIV